MSIEHKKGIEVVVHTDILAELLAHQATENHESAGPS